MGIVGKIINLLLPTEDTVHVAESKSVAHRISLSDSSPTMEHTKNERKLRGKKKPMNREQDEDAFVTDSTMTYSSDEEFCDAIEVVKKPIPENGYVEGKWRNNFLIELDSCQFSHPANGKSVYIRKQTPGYLFTFDQERFIIRISFDKVEDLDFTKHALSIREHLLQKLQIIQVIEDEDLSDRDEAFKVLTNLLIERNYNTTRNLEYAEDLFQILNRSEYCQKFSSNMPILENLVRNRNISLELQESVHKLLTSEKAVNSRREEFHELPQCYTIALARELKRICTVAIENHKKMLQKKYAELNIEIAPTILTDHFSQLHNRLLLFISYKDMELFADLIDIMKEKPFIDFVIDVWETFFKQVEKKQKDLQNYSALKQVAPLTSPIYFYLCKSFKELVFEIKNKTGISLDDLLKKNQNEKWMLIESITWPTDSMLNNSLEQQYRFIFMAMKHFEPGYYSYQKKFNYKFELLKDNQQASEFFTENSTDKNSKTAALPDERLVWACILDNAIKNLISKREFELFKPLITGFSHFANDTKEDRFESFRVAVRNEIKFIGLTIPYLTKDASEPILKQQIKTMKKAYLERNSVDFKDLVDVFNEFWKNRQSILEAIPKKFPCEDFEENMGKICQALLDIASVALDKDTKLQEIIKYFRSFNEFLEDLNNLDFPWFIKKDEIEKCIPKSYLETIFAHLELINEDKNSYKVLNPENFIHISEKVPQHYIIEIVQDLLNAVLKLLKQNKWSHDDNLNATSELLLAIKKSLLYLKEQPDYVSFDLFKKESIEPFNSVVEKSTSYQDFQKRIAIVGESFWYLRRQDEINIEKALELYKCENSQEIIAAEVLKNCYNKYLERFSFYIQETLDFEFEEKVGYITKEIKKKLTTISKHNNKKINEWNKDFKRENLPELLAGLAAVWSIQESKDISSTGKILKPHCIQVLCIMRLLSVDKDHKGVDKHLAQVLTGQGKSLILGLLSALLALMDYKVRMVCHSEYLATRDEHCFDGFFKNFGVNDKIIYGTFEEMAFEVVSTEVNGRLMNLGELVKDRIFQQNQKPVKPKRETDVSNTILLIDEVDVFFSDEYFGNTLNECKLITFEGLSIIQEKIWEMAQKGFASNVILNVIKDFHSQKILEKHQHFLEFNKFLSEPKKYKLLKRDNGMISEKEYSNRSLFEEELLLMVDCAIKVVNKCDSYFNQFKIGNDGIIAKRKSDGMYSKNSFQGYFNIFSYFRLKKRDFDSKSYKNYGYLYISCGFISYAKLPEEYPLILGVSGTLTTLHDHEKKVVKEFYHINKASIMPTFFGASHIEFDPNKDFLVRDSEEEWLTQIFKHANAQINARRSVIIFFDTDTEIEKFEQMFSAKFDRLHILTLNTEKPIREKYIDEAGITKTITLATRGMGRGVDYKSSVIVEKNGGVHVIQTFFSLDIKEEIQIRGRTARKDCKGSYELIVYTEDLKKDGLDITADYGNLNELRKQKMFAKGSLDEERIKKSEQSHKITMEYLESFFS